MGLHRKLTLTLTNNSDVRKLILHKKSQESYLHIIIKILSYLFFWENDLLIEPDFDSHGYKPDLIEFMKPENPKEIEKEIKLWVECKQVKLKKLDNLVRYLYNPIYWFHTSNYLTRALKSSSYKKFKRLSDVEIIGINTQYFDDLDQLIQELQVGQVSWNIKITRLESREDNNLLKKIEIKLPTLIEPISIEFEKFKL